MGTYSVRKSSQESVSTQPHYEFISSLYMQMRVIPKMKFWKFKVLNKGPFMSTDRQMEGPGTDFGTKLIYPFF